MVALILLTAALTVLAQAVAGSAALAPFGVREASVVIGFPALYGLAALLLMLFQTLVQAPRLLRNQDDRFDLAHLWMHLHKPRLEAVLIMSVAGYGLAASANLVEVYRLSSAHWWDAALRSVEEPLFRALLGSPLDLPRLWDAVYQVVWLGVLAAVAAMTIGDRLPRLARAMAAVVLAFHLTRYLGIAFPNAGPIFYRPELFRLDGTATAALADALRAFMRGEIAQNGLLPGTQGMPSLHVGLAWIAMTTLAREWRWTLWLTVPWFCLNWASTVFLGWHYALDGVGGVAVMAGSIALVERLDRVIRSVPRAMALHLRRSTAGRRQALAPADCDDYLDAGRDAGSRPRT